MCLAPSEIIEPAKFFFGQFTQGKKDLQREETLSITGANATSSSFVDTEPQLREKNQFQVERKNHVVEF